MLGKLGITFCVGSIYVFTTELFPTVVRSSGLSACSATARIGSMVSPYISGLSKLVCALLLISSNSQMFSRVLPIKVSHC